MTGATPSAMALIENERRRDRLTRRVCIAAWSVSLALVLVVAILVALQTGQFVRGAARGELPWAVVVGSTMPLIDVLWKLSLLVSAMSTVALFLRQRTASLAEIQVRLAALEEMVGSRLGTPGDQPR